ARLKPGVPGLGSGMHRRPDCALTVAEGQYLSDRLASCNELMNRAPPHHHHDHSHPHGSGAADAGLPAVVRDPVCGMTVDPEAGKPSAMHEGRLVYFCCEACRKKFEAAPEDYLTATDPVCGMNVDRASARHFLRHQGEKHYFCSEGCLKKFE